MKTLLLTISILLSTHIFASSNIYKSAIMKGKAMLNEADSISEFIKAANYFERVSTVEMEEWLPLYYQSLALAFAGQKMKSQDQEDKYQQALALIEKAEKIEAHSEVVALKGFVQMLRISADPANRGQSLSPLVFGLFQKALKLAPDNPRALLFMGQMEYGTAQFFGSSSDKACQYLIQANMMYQDQTTKETIYPSWGANIAKQSINLCSE